MWIIIPLVQVELYQAHPRFFYFFIFYFLFRSSSLSFLHSSDSQSSDFPWASVKKRVLPETHHEACHSGEGRETCGSDPGAVWHLGWSFSDSDWRVTNGLDFDSEKLEKKLIILL